MLNNLSGFEPNVLTASKMRLSRYIPPWLVSMGLLWILGRKFVFSSFTSEGHVYLYSLTKSGFLIVSF